jgi:phospholipid transport system substrate-binding protein
MKYFSALVFLIFTLAGQSALGAEQPFDRLSGTVDAALNVLYADSSGQLSVAQKQAKVRSVLEEHYDLTILIRRSMGRNWKLLKLEEQARVSDLIKQLIVKSYVEGLNGKERPAVSYGEVIQVSDKRLEVPSTIVLGDKTFNLLYRLGRLKSGWQIYDIVAEDISVVSNYRQQFDDHFRKANGAQLIEKLEELLNQEELNESIEL